MDISHLLTFCEHLIVSWAGCILLKRPYEPSPNMAGITSWTAETIPTPVSPRKCDKTLTMTLCLLPAVSL